MGLTPVEHYEPDDQRAEDRLRKVGANAESDKDHLELGQDESACDGLQVASTSAEQRGTTDYNRGNALTHLGKLPQALDAYAQALKQDPQFADAKHNRNLVRKWLKPQQQKQQKSGGQGHPQRKNGADGKPQTNGQSQQQGGKQPQPNPQGDKQRQGGKNENGGDKQSGAQHNGGGKPPARQPRQPAQQQPPGQSPGTAQNKPSGSNDGQAQQPPGTTQPTQEKRRPSSQAGAATVPQSESEQATQQWLRRIPDDPGGLWRRKFLYQYKREYQSQQSEAKPW